VTTALTPDTCKAVVEDATVKEAVDPLSDIGPEKAVFCCKPIVIDLLQHLKVILNALVILRVLWFARLVYGRRVGHDLFFLKQDKGMPENLYCKLN